MTFLSRRNTNIPVKLGSHPMANMVNEMNHLFDRMTVGMPRTELAPLTEMSFIPSIDIQENDKEYTVEAELPGVLDKDIELALENNTLMIKGEKRAEEKEERENYYHLERSYGSFYRTIPFTSEVDDERVKANYKNGILKINIAKSAKAVTARRKIDIQKG